VVARAEAVRAVEAMAAAAMVEAWAVAMAVAMAVVAVNLYS